MQMVGLFFLVAVATGGFAWVFVYPFLSGERKVEKRKQSVAQVGAPARSAVARSAQAAHKSRREQVEGTLRDLEERRAKAKSPSLSMRISQAGLTWSKNRFFITAACLGLVGFVLGLALNTGLLPAVAFAFAGAVGLPLWLLRFLKRRREAKFLEALPDAVDVIVRGIKSGLPLLDSMKVIVADAPEPLRSEFRAIIDTQAIGLPLGEACGKLYERIPVAEANFFGIVVSIQQKSGGNLSEALGNLSRVLRDRKKMAAKIQAMSMEAKASAAIIGSLPPIVMALMYFTSSEYISLLWTDPTGRMFLAGCGVWMTVGVLVMRKMINFDF
jgi:tight adherence protein B